MTILGLALACVFGAAVAIYDLRTMTIPNWLSGAAAVVFLVLIFAVTPQAEAVDRLIGALVVLAAGMALFFAGAVGGGDVKAAAAFALMVAPADRSVVLIILALTGLLGVALIAAARRTPLGRGQWAVWREARTFPYGLALGATLIVYMTLTVIFLG